LHTHPTPFRSAGRAGGAPAAGKDEGRDHPVAALPAADTWARRLHHAAEFVAGDLRQHHAGARARPGMPVGAADAAGEHRKDDAVLGTDGLGPACQGNGRAVPGEDRGPHQATSTLYFSMTVLARSFSHIAFTSASAAVLSVAVRSSSITLPWRTASTPWNPSVPSACFTASPCGSRTPSFGMTWTRASIVLGGAPFS